MAERKANLSGYKSEISQVPGRRSDAVPGQKDSLMCQPCFNKNKRTAAAVFCQKCNEFQCADCSQIHNVYAFLKTHQLIDANKGKQSLVDMKGLDECNQHKKSLKLLCQDENQLCCSTCAIVTHRRCHSVVEIQTIAGNSSNACSDVLDSFKELRSKTEIVLDYLKSSKEQLQQDKKEIPLKLNRMQDDVDKMFDDLELSVCKRTEAFQAKTNAQLMKKQLTCEKHAEEVTKSLETIENVCQNGTPSQQFIVEHNINKRANEIHAKVEETCRDLETVSLSFDFDETLKIPPLAIAEYIPGQITLKYNISDSVKSIAHEDPFLKLEKITSIDLKQTGDDVKEPLYTGLDFLPDRRLVAVDNKNKKCLIFSENLEKVGSYQLSYIPQSVVAVSEEEVAISCDVYKIDFLRISKSNEITLIRTCNVKTEYGSICMKDDGNFVVGTIDHTRPVRIVSLSGEEKDFNIRFPNKKYPLDTSACTYIMNSNKVVLIDRDEHTVYINDIAADTRVVVKDDQIKEPYGVAVGPSDCILVCSRKTDSIVQISQTGRIVSSYKLDAGAPYRVCVTKSKTVLAVATNWIGNMKLQMFRITQ